jgi:hypothetical protein
MVATWTLSGMDGYAEIESFTDSSCVIKRLADATTLIQGTLSCVLKKRYNNSSLFTITKLVEILNESIAETDIGIVTALYNAGLCSNSSYITKEEAALVTEFDLQPGNSSSTSIFYSQINNIKSFNGFKYFTAISKIQPYLFASCDYLESITLPQSITHIYKYAFNGCKFESINLPNTLIDIDEFSFFQCRKLSSITLPEGLTHIGRYAFSYTALTEVVIPSSIVSMGSGIFSNVSTLQKVVFPEVVPNGFQFRKGLFAECTNLISINIPEGVENIAPHVFKGNKFTKIHLPSTLKVFGKDQEEGSPNYSNSRLCESFEDMDYLEFTVSSGNKTFTAVNGILYKGSTLQIHMMPNEEYITTFESGIDTWAFKVNNYTKKIIITEDVLSISSGAFTSDVVEEVVINSPITKIDGFFNNCPKLKSVKIPSTVESIKSYSFSYCKALESITIPNGVTKIEDGTFSSCSSLASIDLPDNVTSIGNSAFSYCSSLSSITIPDGVTSIGSSAFYSCTSLTSITIPNSVTSIGGSAFYGCTSLTSINIPDTIKKIETGTFYNCTSLTSITVPDSVTSIGAQAFYNCTSLASINILEGVTSIGNSAFYNCTSLASIDLPDSVTSIGNDAFRNCTSLTSITLSTGVTSVGNSMFSWCTSLTSMSIPEGWPKVGVEMFKSCTSLTSITIPSSVTNVANYAFQGCTSLTSIICMSAVASEISSGSFGTSTSDYTGRKTYNTGENMLYVPQGATGYDTGAWFDPLQNAEKCGFTLSATL